MSYSRPALARRRTRRGLLGALGDGFDDLIRDLERINEVQCAEVANASGTVKAIEARQADLSANWNPTGFYTPGEIQSIVTSVASGVAEARTALATATLSTADAAERIRDSHRDLDGALERGAVYETAMATARTQGMAAINAPGLKTWVLRSLNHISNAYMVVAALNCRASWLDTANRVISGIVAVAKRIVGIVAKVGDRLLNVADDVLDLYPLIKWGALGVGAWFVITKLKKARGG